MTILAAFTRDTRFLTEHAILLIHERRLESFIELNGPIRSYLQIVREQLSLLETAQDLEMAGFQELVEGSDLTVDGLYDMATKNCYMKEGARTSSDWRDSEMTAVHAVGTHQMKLVGRWKSGSKRRKSLSGRYRWKRSETDTWQRLGAPAYMNSAVSFEADRMQRFWRVAGTA